MTTTTTVFVQPRPESGRGQAVRRLGRRLAASWRASAQMTAQQRADAYVSRTPVAVLGG